MKTSGTQNHTLFTTSTLGGGERYWFGFNGKENITEVSGWQDYGERFYNTNIARFFSADPLIVYGQQYPELSSYQFASNTPISAIDKEGLQAEFVTFYTTGVTDPGQGYVYVHNKKGTLTPQVQSTANQISNSWNRGYLVGASISLSFLQWTTSMYALGNTTITVSKGLTHAFSQAQAMSTLGWLASSLKDPTYGTTNLGNTLAFLGEKEYLNFSQSQLTLFGDAVGSALYSYPYLGISTISSTIQLMSNSNFLDDQITQIEMQQENNFNSPINSYTIKSGDTLSSIAKKHNTTVDSIAEKNNISNVDFIRAGDTIEL